MYPTVLQRNATRTFERVDEQVPLVLPQARRTGTLSRPCQNSEMDLFACTTSTFAVLLVKGTCCGTKGDSTDALQWERVPVRERSFSTPMQPVHFQTVDFLEMCQKGRKW